MPEKSIYEQCAEQVNADAEGHNDRVKYHAERVKDAIKTFLDTKADWEWGPEKHSTVEEE